MNAGLSKETSSAGSLPSSTNVNHWFLGSRCVCVCSQHCVALGKHSHSSLVKLFVVEK